MPPIFFPSRPFRSSLAPAAVARACAALLCAATLALVGGCAGRPEAPILERLLGSEASSTKARLDLLLPTDVLLLGEQHDAREHHLIEQQVISLLAGRGLLAALTLEMADVGATTAKLKPSASAEQARRALQWDEKSWPWASYEPAVMTAVRAGVPVLGANLPRSQVAGSMDDRQLDARLAGPALKAQQQAIRIGHCQLLPESQISPMTRVQIARDITMADTLRQVAFPGKVAVLLAGNGHVDRTLGVAQHLSGDLTARAVSLRAGAGADLPQAFDAVWITPALPGRDHCTELKAQLASKPDSP